MKEEIAQEICQVIAKYEPFSLEEILDAFKELTSVDQVLYAIELAKRQQCKLEEVVRSKYPIQHIIPSEPYSPGALAKIPASRLDSQRKGRAKVNVGFKIKRENW